MTHGSSATQRYIRRLMGIMAVYVTALMGGQLSNRIQFGTWGGMK